MVQDLLENYFFIIFTSCLVSLVVTRHYCPFLCRSLEPQVAKSTQCSSVEVVTGVCSRWASAVENLQGCAVFSVKGNGPSDLSALVTHQMRFPQISERRLLKEALSARHQFNSSATRGVPERITSDALQPYSAENQKGKQTERNPATAENTWFTVHRIHASSFVNIDVQTLSQILLPFEVVFAEKTIFRCGLC